MVKRRIRSNPTTWLVLGLVVLLALVGVAVSVAFL